MTRCTAMCTCALVHGPHRMCACMRVCLRVCMCMSCGRAPPEEAVDEKKGRDLTNKMPLELDRCTVVLPSVEHSGETMEDVPVEHLGRG